MFTCLISAAAALFGAAAAAAALLLRQKLASGKRTPDAPPQWPPTEWDRRFMAFHEAGHAVASRHLPGRPPLLRVTISPSDEAFGMIRTEENPHHNETRQSLASTLAVLLAGRIAEERFLHEITTSCVHDLAAAKQLAADMVLKLGMGESSGLTLPSATCRRSSFSSVLSTRRTPLSFVSTKSIPQKTHRIQDGIDALRPQFFCCFSGGCPV